VHKSTPTAPARVTSQGGRRAGVAARTRLDFWFDATILVGYTVAYSYGFTGVVIHEWLGIGLGIALLLHLTLHWDWVVRTTRRLISPRGHDKLIWLVNLLLMFAMAADLVVLRTTALIEAAVIAAVMIVDASLRKRRRARRASLMAGPPGGETG
jgi:hypothetical protein